MYSACRYIQSHLSILKIGGFVYNHSVKGGSNPTEENVTPPCNGNPTQDLQLQPHPKIHRHSSVIKEVLVRTSSNDQSDSNIYGQRIIWIVLQNINVSQSMIWWILEATSLAFSCLWKGELFQPHPGKINPTLQCQPHPDFWKFPTPQALSVLENSVGPP